MGKNQKRVVLVLAILLIVFTVFAFALPFKKNGLFWLSYLFGIAELALQIYVLKAAFCNGEDSAKSKFYGFPIAEVGAIYLAVQLVLSLIFMAFAGLVPIWAAVIIYVLILAAAAIGFIGTDAVRDEAVRQDIKLNTDTACIMRLRSIAGALPKMCSDPEIRSQLAELADEFKYSDPVSSDALKETETRLEEKLEALREIVSEQDFQFIGEKCREVSALLSERNRLCRQYKGK